MALTYTALPNDIRNWPGGTNAELWVDIGENFEASEDNDDWTQDQVEWTAFSSVGASVLPGTTANFLTGVGTATFSLAEGTRVCVPQGTYGSQTRAAIVETSAVITQGAAGAGTNYVYLVRTPATGALAMSVTTSATPPANATRLASAVVSDSGGLNIDSIALAPIVTEATPIVIGLPGFVQNSTTKVVVPMATARPVAVQSMAIACDAVPAGGTLTVDVKAKTSGGATRSLLAAAMNPETLVTLTGSQLTLTATTADLSIADTETIIVECAASDAPVTQDWTGATLTLWVTNA
jgi:hypothetical protein